MFPTQGHVFTCFWWDCPRLPLWFPWQNRSLGTTASHTCPRECSLLLLRWPHCAHESNSGLTSASPMTWIGYWRPWPEVVGPSFLWRSTAEWHSMFTSNRPSAWQCGGFIYEHLGPPGSRHGPRHRRIRLSLIAESLIIGTSVSWAVCITAWGNVVRVFFCLGFFSRFEEV